MWRFSTPTYEPLIGIMSRRRFVDHPGRLTGWDTATFARGQEVYDVIIVGSGYGGSVMAARLAPRARVLLLERGRAWRPGDFPTTLLGLARAWHGDKNPAGLWAMRLGRGTGNAYVSGLGGASLVNYGITAQPEDHTFARWPVSAAEMAPYYARARAVLRPSHAPFADRLGDKAFIDWIEPGRRVDLENTIDWDKCTACGYCVPGCNVGAKRSLDRTYLALAAEAGAEIQAEREVLGFRARPDGWEVVVQHTGEPARTETLTTRHLVLAAGTFGTLDLLHRERATLPLSPWFGRAMTMNGDGLAFLYDTRHRVDTHHGAPITTTARLTFVDPEGAPRTLSIMSGRIPALALRLSAATMGLFAELLGERTPARDRDPLATRLVRRARDLLGPTSRGALAHTFMYKLDAQDSGRGHAVFDARGRSALEWPDYQDDPIMRFAAARLERWGEQVGATRIRDVSTLPGLRSFGVHPLGGCRMGRDIDDGVVDPFGRVLRPEGGVYQGLRIVDASVIPSSLGVPSSLTVAAIAERAAEHLAGELAA